jgi:paraquat-inducible protein B
MKTRRDAERVVELSDKRENLHKLASSIRMADEIAVGDPVEIARELRSSYTVRRDMMFTFSHLADELRDLIKRETVQQIAEIDKELKALGVEPDEFEAAAPKGREDSEKQKQQRMLDARLARASAEAEEATRRVIAAPKPVVANPTPPNRGQNDEREEQDR